MAYLAALEAGRSAPRSRPRCTSAPATPRSPWTSRPPTPRICPTDFQAAQFPPLFRRALTVLHDGIDTDRFRPDPAARRDTLGGLVAEDARVITYATRGMEPHRGFPQFMAALPAVLAADPKAVAVVAGENRVAYGGEALRRVDWKARALAENDIDPARVHFVGHLAPADYLRLLQRSDAHVYLTVPFVLSWSMLEAMSAGCGLVALRHRAGARVRRRRRRHARRHAAGEHRGRRGAHARKRRRVPAPRPRPRAGRGVAVVGRAVPPQGGAFRGASAMTRAARRLRSEEFAAPEAGAEAGSSPGGTAAPWRRRNGTPR